MAQVSHSIDALIERETPRRLPHGRCPIEALCRLSELIHQVTEFRPPVGDIVFRLFDETTEFVDEVDISPLRVAKMRRYGALKQLMSSNANMSQSLLASS